MAQYEVTLRDYWRILRRRRGIVLFTATVLGFFSFVVAAVWQPLPVYTAESKIQINTSLNVAGGYLQSLSYGGTDEIETQQAIITSYRVMERVGAALDLFGWATTAEDTARIVLGLPSRINTRQEGYTNIIAVEATDSSPVMARDLANTVALVFRDYDHELKNQQNVKHRRFVEGQLKDARLALRESEEAVRLYREETQLISLSAQTSVTLQQITQSERLARQLRADLGGIDVMLEEMTNEKGVSDDFMKGASRARVGETFMGLARNLDATRLERDGMLVKYTDQHPTVQQLDVKITQLGNGLKEELRRRRESIVRDLSGENARLVKLRDDYRRLPASGLGLARLEREVELRQEVTMALEERYQMALSREADVVEEVTILQDAITPFAPANPHPSLRQAVMGFVLGLFLGVVFAVVVEMLDTSIGTIEDVQEYIGTQVVGVIPYIDVEQVKTSLEIRGLAVGDEHTVARKAQLVYVFDPQSTLAETYRTLRTNIEFATMEKGVKELMVTSSSFGEGKSTVIANLAMSMAQLGKRTLLVDADLRKPTIARMFGLEREPGLTEIIIGNHPWREVVRTLTDIVTGDMGLEGILQTQGISNLHIIPSGAIPPNPAELLNSQRTSEFIEEVRDAYDMVLFDTPPVLQASDAAILGKKIGVTVMVYKAGDIPRTSLKRSSDLLRSMEIDLLGVVLNGISADMGSDYEDFGYHTYYAYGAEEMSPTANLVDRLRNYVTGWRGSSNGTGGAQATADHPVGSSGDRRSSSSRRKASPLSYLMLALVGLGFIWQSGYLHRSFGAIPLLERYEITTEHEDWDENGVAGGEVPTAMTALRRQTEPFAAREVVGAADSVPVSPRSPAPEPGVREAVPSGRAPASPLPVLASLEAVERGRTRQPWAIRTASYEPSSNWALRSLRRLRLDGEAAFLSPVVVRGRTLERLLIGSFASWDAAHKHARQLLEDGRIEEFAVLKLPYTVELQTFAGRDQLQTVVVSSPGDEPFAYTQELGGGSYRLVIGAFATEEEARRHAEALAAAVGEVTVAIR